MFQYLYLLLDYFALVLAPHPGSILPLTFPDVYDAGKEFTRRQPLALEVIHSRLAESMKHVVIIPINIKRLDEYVKVHKYVIVVSIFFIFLLSGICFRRVHAKKIKCSIGSKIFF